MLLEIEVMPMWVLLVTTIRSASRHFFRVISVYQETRNFFEVMPIISNFAWVLVDMHKDIEVCIMELVERRVEILEEQEHMAVSKVTLLM